MLSGLNVDLLGAQEEFFHGRVKLPKFKTSTPSSANQLVLVSNIMYNLFWPCGHMWLVNDNPPLRVASRLEAKTE